MTKNVNLIGKTFGRLTVVSQIENLKDTHVMYSCKCSCGKENTVRRYDLEKQRIESCGCIKADRIRKGVGESACSDVIGAYKRKCKHKNRNFLLTNEEAKSIMLKPCAYCGAPPSNIRKSKYNSGSFVYSGLDRIDNTGHYTIDNVNPCCSQCNDAKSSYSIAEYFTWVKLVCEHTMNKENNQINTPNDFNESAFSHKCKVIKEGAVSRNIKFEISKEDIKNTIFNDCFYCGSKPFNEIYSYDKKYKMLTNGIDRLDNSIGYTKENIVPCCYKCNYAKNEYTKEMFYEHVKKVYEYNNLNEYTPQEDNNVYTMKHFTQIKK